MDNTKLNRFPISLIFLVLGLLVIDVKTLQATNINPENDDRMVNVLIEMHTENSEDIFHGNGFFVDDQILITNFQGIGPEVKKIKVFVPTEQQLPELDVEGVLAVDTKRDIVALKAQQPAEWQTAVRLVQLAAKEVKEGESVRFDSFQLVIPGMAAARTYDDVNVLKPLALRDLQDQTHGNLIRIDQKTKRGEAGSPVFTTSRPDPAQSNQFVGMVAAFNATWGISYLVPAEAILRVADEARAKINSPQSIEQWGLFKIEQRRLDARMDARIDDSDPDSVKSIWEDEVWDAENNGLQEGVEASLLTYVYAANAYIQDEDYHSASAVFEAMLQHSDPLTIEEFLVLDNAYFFYSVLEWLAGDFETAGSFYDKAVTQDAIDGGKFAIMFEELLSYCVPGKERELRAKALEISEVGYGQLAIAVMQEAAERWKRDHPKDEE